MDSYLQTILYNSVPQYDTSGDILCSFYEHNGNTAYINKYTHNQKPIIKLMCVTNNEELIEIACINGVKSIFLLIITRMHLIPLLHFSIVLHWIISPPNFILF